MELFTFVYKIENEELIKDNEKDTFLQEMRLYSSMFSYVLHLNMAGPVTASCVRPDSLSMKIYYYNWRHKLLNRANSIASIGGMFSSK